MLARLVHEAERRRRRGKGTLMTGTSAATKLHRTAFRTSRLLDFCSRKELIAQTGHQPDDWPLVVLKELIDNALDAWRRRDRARFALLAGMTGFAGSRRAYRTGCSRNQKGVLTDDEHGRHETNDGCRQKCR